MGELILILFLLFIGYGFCVWIYELGTGAGRVVKHAITGDGNYFGPAELKFTDERHEETGLNVKRIMFRGAIPNSRTMRLSYAISVMDVTDGADKMRFVLSIVDTAQEVETPCYFQGGEIGAVAVGSSFPKWIPLGVIVPEMLQPSTSGFRQMCVIVRIFNSDNSPIIHAGFSDGDGELVWSRSLKFGHNFVEKGYEEAVKDREESQAISLKIGVAVAMADGHLDDSEGDVLKQWVIKSIAPFGEDQQTRMKQVYNQALKEGYTDSMEGRLNVDSLIQRLSEIGEKKSKYDAIELCLDVMAADGVADPKEMEVIRRAAKDLDLDMDEIERMREKVTLDLSGELTSEEGLESLVGIESFWDDDEKRKHLRTEFQKWSNRLNTLPEGNDRERAQNMLDSIATLRKKYG